MKFPRLQRRTLMLLAVAVPLAVLFVYVALRSGPLAPVAVTVTQVESRSIAPALAAILFRGTLTQAHLTIGEDPGTASALSAMGAVHEARPVHATCLDTDNRIVSTPAYMLGPGPAAVFRGIKKLIEELLGLVR